MSKTENKTSSASCMQFLYPYCLLRKQKLLAATIHCSGCLWYHQINIWRIQPHTLLHPHWRLLNLDSSQLCIIKCLEWKEATNPMQFSPYRNHAPENKVSIVGHKMVAGQAQHPLNELHIP